jgi:hypothetical protein
MSYDPTKLDHLEILSLLAIGLTEYFERIKAGEKDPFPYPDALIRGFNQLLIACALQNVERAKRPKGVLEFMQTWGRLPLMKWALQLEVFGYTFTVDDSLIEPNLSRPTQLCRDLARDLKLGQTKACVGLKK